MTHTSFKKTLILSLSCIALSACGTMDKINNIGKPPPMSTINNPVTNPQYQPISMPMPSPENVRKERNSLWASNRQTFFKDQRAGDVGDIITVVIDIQDEAELENTTIRTRNTNEDAGLSSFLGLESGLDAILPEAVTPANLVGMNSTSTLNGIGSTEREEAVDVKLAAIVTQILPNGNMVINGRQEVLVNFEKRVLQIDGVIRPEDIGIRNTISYEKIAEARIVYGGEGQLTDVQQPRYGQQLYDIVFPF